MKRHQEKTAGYDARNAQAVSGSRGPELTLLFRIARG